jgi:hypothetical protein
MQWSRAVLPRFSNNVGIKAKLQKDFSGHMALIPGASAVFVPYLVKVHSLPPTLRFSFFTTTFALQLHTILRYGLFSKISFFRKQKEQETPCSLVY